MAVIGMSVIFPYQWRTPSPERSQAGWTSPAYVTCCYSSLADVNSDQHVIYVASGHQACTPQEPEGSYLIRNQVLFTLT